MQEPNRPPGSAHPDRPWHALAAFAFVLALGWILHTHGQLTHAADEPMHLAVGLEWWQRGTHRLNPETPALSHVANALGLHLAGVELPPEGAPFRRGVEVLYGGDDYFGRLRLARLGTLPFYALAAAIVWLWGRRLGGARAAALATVSFAALPPVLGHAGLATSELASVATILWTLLALVRWLEAPSLGRAAHLGLAFGLALTAKFSVLAFVPPSLVAILVLRFAWPGASDTPRASGGLRARSVELLLAGACAVLVAWGVYRFSVGSLWTSEGGQRAVELAFPVAGSLGRRLGELGARLWCLAPDLGFGLLRLVAHAGQGHTAYLMGERSADGFWHFYPVVLALKTPLAFMAFAALGTLAAVRGCGRSWRALAPAAAGLAILAVSMKSPINIGVRHVLVLYPLVAITAGYGWHRMLEAGALARGAVALLLGLQLFATARAHPDHMAWCNALAGDEPGELVLDSDLDWGQDVAALARELEGRDVERLHVAVFGSARLCEHGLPPVEWLPPGQPVSGWVAISEMYFRHHWSLTYEDACERARAIPSDVERGYAWLAAHEPVARAGKSIRIYHVPERAPESGR